MKSYRLSAEQIANMLGSNLTSGLGDLNIIENQKKYGLNSSKTKRRSYIGLFFDLYKNVCTLGLIIAALVYAAISAITKQYTSIITSVVILVIMLLYSIIRTAVSEYYAKKFETYSKKASQKVTVLRNGKTQVIDASLLVPGDIISLTAGDIVPADARIFNVDSLVVNEQVITKSRVPKEKNVDIIDKDNIAPQQMDNMVFANTVVLSGTARAIVTDTGAFTLYNKLSLDRGLKRAKQSIITRFKELDRFVQIVLAVISTLYFIISVALHNDLSYSLIYVFTITAFCAVTVIPELIRNLFNNTAASIAKSGLVMDDYQTVQTLSRIDTLCLDLNLLIKQSDKKLTHCVLSDGCSQIKEADDKQFLQLIMYAALCCHDKNSHLTKAIFHELNRLGISEQMLERRCTLVSRDKNIKSDKYQASVYVMDSNVFAIYMGQTDEILKRCTQSDFTDMALSQYSHLSDEGYQCIAVAVTSLGNIPADFDANSLADLSLVGLLAAPCEVDKKTRALVKSLKDMSVRPVIFTDSNPLLAIRIASSLDIFGPKDIVINCQQISGMGYSDLADAANKAVVVCASSPKPKQQVLTCMRDKGKSVLLITSDLDDQNDINVCDALCAEQQSSNDILIKKANLVAVGKNTFSACVNAIRQSKFAIMASLMLSMFLVCENIGVLILSLLNIAMPTRFFINVIELALINMPVTYILALLTGFLSARMKPFYKIPGRKFLAVSACVMGAVFAAVTTAAFAVNGLPFAVACAALAVAALLWSFFPKFIIKR